MSQAEIKVCFEDNQVFAGVVPLPIELGRQHETDSEPFAVQDIGDGYRMAIADRSAIGLTRRAFKIFAEDGWLQVKNIHSSFTFTLQPLAAPLPPQEVRDVGDELTVELTSGYSVVVANGTSTKEKTSQHDYEGSASLRTMDSGLAGLSADESDADLGQLLRDEPTLDQGRLAVSLVHRALEVVNKSAGSDEFFVAAAESAAKMIGLDNAHLLLWDPESEWRVGASYSRQKNETWRHEDGEELASLPPGSAQLLERLLRDERTIVFEPDNFMHTANSSLMMLDRAVASPVWDSHHKVIGALYGDRKFGSKSPNVPIGELEAALLEVMAGAVSAGIARQREEDKARQEENLRSSMDQFFSPEVLSRLREDENLLEGRDADVTVLFCDIRGFSAISERVGPGRTIDWINDVLTELSQCVLDTDGVLVDYVGDELMAMWGAPDLQPDHASRACRAALAMLQRVEPLRKRWRDITPDRFGIGIGVNTGKARVGNTGSKQKFKYGPLGNVVNIASRIQGMTKHFGVTALITESTHQELFASGETDTVARRRIAEVQPLGVQSHLQVYQIKDNPDVPWHELKEKYEQALHHFRSGDLTEAAASLVQLLRSHPDDVPSMLLLQRVVGGLPNTGKPIDPVVRLQQK